jgi:hypothetical protein
MQQVEVNIREFKKKQKKANWRGKPLEEFLAFEM